MHDQSALSFAPEERAKFRRLNTEQAINLARQSKWGEAVEVNERLIGLFPNDADALNRLGKALTELGRYSEGLDSYERALAADPTNAIAQKNVARLKQLKAEGTEGPPVQQRYDPSLFIEEPGKTTVTTLVNVVAAEVLAPLAAGDQLNLVLAGSIIKVHDPRDQFIGQLEPKLTLRLLGLINSGNEYAAAITAIDDHQVRVIIRETYQNPNNAGKVAFPTSAGGEGVRPYMRDSVLRYELEDEDEEYGEDGEYGETEGLNEEVEGGDTFEDESAEP